jgi:hypothetical protein
LSVEAISRLLRYLWSAGHAAWLDGARLTVIAATTATLSLLMVLLRDVVLIHRRWFTLAG